MTSRTSRRMLAVALLVVLGILFLTMTPSPSPSSSGHAGHSHGAHSNAHDESSSSSSSEDSGESVLSKSITDPGLRQLMGSYLSSDAATSRHWHPNTSWYDANEATLIQQQFPSCQSPLWCDAMFPREETADVQGKLWEAFGKPRDCGKARLLLVDTAWAEPMGASLHMMAMVLQIALREGRALVTTLDAAAVPTDSEHDECVRGGDKTWQCYFKPLAVCRGTGTGTGTGAGTGTGTGTTSGSGSDLTTIIPADAPVFDLASHAHSAHRIVRLTKNHVEKCGRIDLHDLPASSPLIQYRDKPSEWWMAQLMKFVVRPNPWVLQQLVYPVQHAAFFQSEGVIPHPVAGIFVPHGGNIKHSLDEYFNLLEPVAKKLDIKHVYINSNSFAPVEDALKRYSDKYTLHFLDYNHFDERLTLGDVSGAMHAKKLQRHMKLSLADLYITAQMDVMVGALSSYWCRLGDELRKTAGRARLPYLTPEVELISNC